MSYEITELDTNDLGHVFDLTVEAGLNAGRSKQAWIEVQHWLLDGSRKTTGITAPLGHVMHEMGALVGFVGYSQRLFKSDGNISPAVVLNDLVVHPAHRGMAGIMLCKHTIQYFKNRSEDWKILGLHHSREAAALWKALRSKDVPDTGLTFTAVVSPADFLSTRLPLLRPIFHNLQALGGIPFVNTILARSGRPVVAKGSLTMRPCSARDFLEPGNAETDGLLQSFLDVYETGVVRDISYLKWRYADHPARSFQWYGLRDGGGLKAIVVTHRGQDGTATLCELIVDVVDDAKSFEDVLRAALFACGGEGAAVVRSKLLLPAGIEAFRAIVAGEEEKEYNQFWISPAPNAVRDALYTFGDNKVF